MGEITTIPLKKTTRDKLKTFGKKGETYDEVIRKLLQLAEQVEFYNIQKLILEDEEFIAFEKL
ncbi:MAG: DUF7557 family protein [Promethearchaeota archaeon]